MSPPAPRCKILVIEDEPDILELIAYNLRREDFQVDLARDGRQGLDAARRERPDLVILDLMLPDTDGLAVAARLKADPAFMAIPIIMVTARGEERDVVRGLEAGADDYLPKPFGPRELVARVRAVLRRSPPSAVLCRGGLRIDMARHEVQLDSREIVFTPTEFRLLYALAANPGRVYTRGQLLDSTLGAEAGLLERNIDVHVRAIRRKLGEDPSPVETVRGVGYRFHAE